MSNPGLKTKQLRQKTNIEACKGAALSRSDSLSNPGFKTKQLRQKTNIEACKGESLR